MTMPAVPPIRVARWNGVCGAPGCTRLIYVGAPITKSPGRAWRHADCSKPGKRPRADRDAERNAERVAMLAASRRG